jgi:hypothetical protein
MLQRRAEHAEQPWGCICIRPLRERHIGDRWYSLFLRLSTEPIDESYRMRIEAGAELAQGRR